MRAYTYTHARTHTRTHTHARTHAHSHTCAHTHTHMYVCPPPCQAEVGHAPRPGHTADADRVLALAHQLNNKVADKAELSEDILRKLAHNASGMRQGGGGGSK